MAVAYVLAAGAGCGIALGFFAWATVLFGMDSPTRFGTVLAAVLVFGAADGLAAVASTPGLIAIVAVCAIVLVLCAGARKSREAWGAKADGAEGASCADRVVEVGGDGPDILRSMKPLRRFSTAYLIYAFVFGVTFGVSSFYYDTGEGALQSVISGFAPGSLGGGCLLLVAFAVWGERFNLKALSTVISPLLTVLFLLHIMFESSFSSELVSVTFSLWWIVSAFLFLTLVDVGGRAAFSRPGSFPLGWAMVQTGLALGALVAQAASMLFGSEAVTPNMITACSLILVVVATAMLVGAATPFDAARGAIGLFPAPDESGEGEGRDSAGGTVRDPLVDICGFIASKHALTAREEEVLVLLAQGHTRNGIAHKLVVSDNTVRAHVKSIYHKLHIHSKQELVDIVDGYRSLEA